MAIDYDSVMLGHGSGGLMMKRIIDDVFRSAFENDILSSGDDAAILEIGDKKRLAFSTDSFVVSPHFFPGGDIGRLAVCGTVNDVATAGARPIALSIGFILEEGYPISDLKKICSSIAAAASEAGVCIVTGDTKVVGRGSCDGIFINTSGVGVLDPGVDLSGSKCQPGDKIILTGTLGDHGITIMTQREGLEISSDVESDAAPLNHLVQEVLQKAPSVRCFRDPTRGGLASTLNEFAEQSSVSICIEEQEVPVRDSVRGVCEMLGYDVYQVANEGKLAIVVPDSEAKCALAACQNNKYGQQARIIGEVLEVDSVEVGPRVYLETAFGSRRILDMLVGEQLPRIC